MGKRDQRRKRQQRRKRDREKKRLRVPQPILLHFPQSDHRIRVVIKPGTPREVQYLCQLYWEITDDGAWARRVSEIGAMHEVTASVYSASHALLLKSACVNCAEPIEVENRSWAARIAGAFLDRVNGTYRCWSCSAMQETDRHQEQERKTAEAQAKEERTARERAEKITRMWEREDAKCPSDSPSHLPASAASLLVLLAMCRYSGAAPNMSIPSLAALGPVGWTGDTEQDLQAVQDLYTDFLIALHPETSADALSIGDDGRVRYLAVYAQWRLIGGLSHAQQTAARCRHYVLAGTGQRAADLRTALKDLVVNMQVADVVTYLNGLLTNKYGYPSIPDTRRPELVDSIRLGLEHGYTTGQMICFAWRAADTAAGWKERNARMGPPEASSATVTILDNKVRDTIERRWPVPEYEPPKWQERPLALVPGQELLSAVRSVRSPQAISACEECDHQGFVEENKDGHSVLRRCLHTTPLPSQSVRNTSSNDSDDVPPIEDPVTK